MNLTLGSEMVPRPEERHVRSSLLSWPGHRKSHSDSISRIKITKKQNPCGLESCNAHL